MRWVQTPRSATASCVADPGHQRPVGLTPKIPTGYRSNLLLTCTSAVLICASGCAVTRFNVSDSRCCETCTAVECDPSNNGTRSGICKNDREELTACQISAGCDVPRELRKVTLPDYLIEIPDILLCAVPEAAESGRDSEIRAVYKITWTALARGMQHTKTKGPATRPEISVARCSHIPT